MNLSSLLNKRKNLLGLLRIFSDCHINEDGRIYLVGGAVRDLILGNDKIRDLDILITSGQPCEYAECLKKTIFVDRIIKEHKFNTVKLVAEYMGESFSIDINHTRIENYANPGNLPEIKWVDSLFYDMQRRDFSINSIAMSINNDSFGEILNYSNGINDLIDKSMRILHEKSFQDDPSRLIRLIRYRERLGFEIENKTKSLFNKAVSEDYLKHISKDRIYNEMVKCLNEDNSHRFFNSFNSFGLFNEFNFDTSDLERFEKCTDNKKNEVWISSDRILLKLLLLKSPLFLICNIPGNYKKCLENHIANSIYWKNAILSSKSNSELYQIASSIPDESLTAIAFSNFPGNDLWILINNYLKSLKDMKTNLTGKDLISMGINPGKRIRMLLDEILLCRMDGIISDNREAEIEFIENKLGRNV